jgi:hypothetical protein
MSCASLKWNEKNARKGGEFIMKKIIDGLHGKLATENIAMIVVPSAVVMIVVGRTIEREKKNLIAGQFLALRLPYLISTTSWKDLIQTTLPTMI